MFYNAESTVSHSGHLGGLVAGILMFLYKRRGGKFFWWIIKNVMNIICTLNIDFCYEISSQLFIFTIRTQKCKHRYWTYFILTQNLKQYNLKLHQKCLEIHFDKVSYIIGNWECFVK